MLHLVLQGVSNFIKSLFGPNSDLMSTEFGLWVPVLTSVWVFYFGPLFSHQSLQPAGGDEHGKEETGEEGKALPGGGEDS